MKNDRRWIVVLLLIAAGGAWYRLSQDEPPTEPEEQARPVITTSVEAPVEPPPPEEDDAGPLVAPAAPRDAGLQPADAGSLEPTPAELEAYVARWRAALAPLLRQYPPRVNILRAETLDAGPLRPGRWDAGTPAHKPSVVDAGAAPCTPGVASVSLTTSSSVDVVVFIDTSGSMWDVLDSVAQWLGALHYRLDREGRDVRLVVVADHRWGFKSAKLPPDASVIGQRIESFDVFDILLLTGQAADGWRTLLRPGVPTELVLVTDDSPYRLRSAEPYERRFRELLGPATETTRLHLLGGFGPEPGLLGPTERVVESTCSPHGESPGVVYQQLVMKFGGARASLCTREAMERLHDVLVNPPQPPFCAWTPALPVDANPERLRVLREHGLREQLLLEPPGGCAQPGVTRGYMHVGGEYVLCPTTCAAVKTDRFLALELPYTCR